MGVGRPRDQECKHVDWSLSKRKKISIFLEFLLFQTRFQVGLIHTVAVWIKSACVIIISRLLARVSARFQDGNVDSPSVCQLFGGPREGSAFVFVLLIWTVSAYVTAEHPLSTVKRDWM